VPVCPWDEPLIVDPARKGVGWGCRGVVVLERAGRPRGPSGDDLSWEVTVVAAFVAAPEIRFMRRG